MSNIEEADWKKIRGMVEEIREAYLERKNAELRQMLADDKDSATGSFWRAHEYSQEVSKVLQYCLDDQRRSNMLSKMGAMKANGLLSDDQMAEFSEKTQSIIKLFTES